MAHTITTNFELILRPAQYDWAGGSAYHYVSIYLIKSVVYSTKRMITFAKTYIYLYFDLYRRSEQIRNFVRLITPQNHALFQQPIRVNERIVRNLYKQVLNTNGKLSIF